MLLAAKKTSSQDVVDCWEIGVKWLKNKEKLETMQRMIVVYSWKE